MAQAQRLPRLECYVERCDAEAGTNRSRETVEDLALERQWGCPGFLAQVGRPAEQAGRPHAVAPSGRAPCPGFHQGDRWPTRLRPPDLSQLDCGVIRRR